MHHIELERKQQPDSPLKLPWTGKVRTVVSAAVCAGEQIILADWSANVTALDADTGAKQWNARVQESIIESLFLFDGLVWALDLKGNLNGYEISTGQCQASYPLTPQSWGLRHDGAHIYFVERVDQSWSTQRGRAVKLDLRSGERAVFAEYLAHNPNPLIVITPTQTLGYPLVANGVYDYTTGAISLGEGRYLLEAGEWLFLYEGDAGQCTLQSLGPLLNRRGWGNRSAGMFKIEDTILIFQRQERVGGEDEGYYLQAYEYVAGDQTVRPLGLPMKTNSHGRNYRGASIDQFDDGFLLRADGRYRYLAWTG